ncbi:MAG: hypothetical protein WCR46_06895 [Deltaproteobacteria bacterium]
MNNLKDAVNLTLPQICFLADILSHPGIEIINENALGLSLILEHILDDLRKAVDAKEVSNDTDK